MRLFVAVEVSDRVRDAIRAVLPNLSATAKKSRFVKPEKLHLTLQFLGGVEEDKVAGIAQAMDRALKGESKLALSYRGGGSFGTKKSPRVLWVGVEGDVPELKAIQKKVEEALTKKGFEPEKRAYSPHLTLARAKDLRGDRALTTCVELLEGFAVENDPIKRVVLMQSVQNKEGGEYRVLHATALNEAARSAP